MKKKWRILLAIPLLLLMSTGFVVKDKQTGEPREVYFSCGGRNGSPTQPAEEAPPPPPEQPDDRPPKDGD